MSFLEGIMGRHERLPVYRTIDGGHPAPYPDMTDEQLYNYEVTFNVAKRTFAHPPRPSPAPEPWMEPPRNAQTWMETGPTPAANAPSAHEAAPARERLRRNGAFDAPRYTARKANSESTRQAAGPVLDFSKPVRTITTKQPVDIVTTRARHPVYKVHAYIGDDDVVTVFTLEGRLSENGPHFLENAPEQKQLHLNIYLGAQGAERYRITQHETREEADAADTAAGQGRLACVEVKFDA